MPSSADIQATRGFFGPRAAHWEAKFPDDGPAYDRAVAELAPARAAKVLDAACGTGRALPALRSAVGARGSVLGVDVTPEMLAEAARAGRGALAGLVLADVSHLPLPDGCLDAVFAAGLVSHLVDPVAGLAELARVSRRGARLALFHPVGRAALAHRHGRPAEAGADDLRGEGPITAALASAGWTVVSVDDAVERYLVIASRDDRAGGRSGPPRVGAGAVTGSTDA